MVQVFFLNPGREFGMRRSFLLGFLIGLVLLIVAGVGASRLKQRDKEEEAFRQELVDATSVRFGVLTETQRAHSKIHSQYAVLRGNRTINLLVDEAKRNGKKIVSVGFSVGAGQVPEPQTPETFFAKLTTASDSVIQGKVIKKTSQLTEDSAFLFTDYEVLVTEIFKDNPAAPIHAGSTITVTRPGGKVLIDGIIVKGIDESCRPLPQNGHGLVLFLRFIKETGSYQSTADSGGFEINDSVVHPLTGEALPAGVLQDTRSFLRT